MGKVLSGELSCPCDRSCLFGTLRVKSRPLFWKGFLTQGSKQEVTKIVSFENKKKMVYKHADVAKRPSG